MTVGHSMKNFLHYVADKGHPEAVVKEAGGWFLMQETRDQVWWTPEEAYAVWSDLTQG